jgi:hypothetical protein
MTIAELHRGFKIELDKSTNSGYPAFLPEEIDYWLNAAVTRFIKTRISGLNSHRAGFQANQKRTDDLKALVVTTVYSNISFDSNEFKYSVSYPENYMHMVGEAAYCWSSSICWPRTTQGDPKVIRTDVIEATIENMDSKLANTLSDHRLNRGKAKPIRVQKDNKIFLYTDGNYSVDKYEMTYIKTPSKIDSYSILKGDFSQSVSYIPGDVVRFERKYYICKTASLGAFAPSKFILVKDISSVNTNKLESFLSTTADEILVLAVRLALENISEPRHQSYSQESQLVE